MENRKENLSVLWFDKEFLIQNKIFKSKKKNHKLNFLGVGGGLFFKKHCSIERWSTLYIDINIFLINACVLHHSVVSNSLRPCSLPGSSVHGNFQARILEWAAISYPRGFTWPRIQTHVSCVSCLAGGFFITAPSGKLFNKYI